MSLLYFVSTQYYSTFFRDFHPFLKKRIPRGLILGVLGWSQLGLLHAGDVGVDALIPVQEALDVHLVASLQLSESLVNIGVGTGQVTLHAEVVGSAVQRDGDIDVVAGLTVLVVNSLDGQTLEDFAGTDDLFGIGLAFGDGAVGDALRLRPRGPLGEY